MGSERERKIRADIKAQFALKKECERRALAIVHRMLDSSSVAEEVLKNSANSINPDFYKDIVIERGIANLCGYPVCSNELPSTMARQKYHVSTLTNTVYDIAERLNFCSNHCFKASKYFANQVPSEPLWTRSADEPVHISLLPSEDADSTSKSVEASLFGGTEVVMNAPLATRAAPTKKTMGETSIKESTAGQRNAESTATNLTPSSHEGSDGKDSANARDKTKSGKSSTLVEEYRSLVGEAKLEMIKHLLFDRESELKETMQSKVEEEGEGRVMKTKCDGEKPNGLKGSVTEQHVRTDSSVLDGVGSPSEASSERHYPVILERNLEREVALLKISDNDSANENRVEEVMD